MMLLLNLLESLGFLVNYKKSELTPSKYLTFLGFVIDSRVMSILSLMKVTSTVEEVQSFLQSPLVSGCRLVQLIGTLSATLPAVLPAPLHYWAFQHLMHQALKRGWV